MNKVLSKNIIRTIIILMSLVILSGLFMTVGATTVNASSVSDYIIVKNKNGDGAIKEIENSEYTRLDNPSGGDGTLRVMYAQPVSMEGLTVSIYSDMGDYSKDGGPFFGFFFMTSANNENAYFDHADAEMGVALYKHKSKNDPPQDRMVISENQVHRYPTSSTKTEVPCAYTEPTKDEQYLMSAFTGDGTWIQRLEDSSADSGVKIRFSEENEEWYRLSITNINATLYSGETDVLYVEKSLFELDENNQTYLYFTMKTVTTMCVNVEYTEDYEEKPDDIENEDIDDGSWREDFLFYKCDSVRTYDGIQLNIKGAYPNRANYNVAQDATAENGFDIKLRMDGAAYYSSKSGSYLVISLLNNPNQFYKSSDETTDGIYIRMQLKPEQTSINILTAKKMDENERIINDNLSAKISDGSEININVSYRTEETFLDGEIQTLVININGSEFKMTEKDLKLYSCEFDWKNVYLGFGAKTDDTTCPHIFTIQQIGDKNFITERPAEPGDSDTNVPETGGQGCNSSLTGTGILGCVYLGIIVVVVIYIIIKNQIKKNKDK